VTVDFATKNGPYTFCGSSPRTQLLHLRTWMSEFSEDFLRQIFECCVCWLPHSDQRLPHSRKQSFPRSGHPFPYAPTRSNKSCSSVINEDSMWLY
jgi:hypothetical protein